MKTKYNIGETVDIEMTIRGIYIGENGVRYVLAPAFPIKSEARDSIRLYESDLQETDMIPTENYERDVNRLKDEVKRYKELYQFEHEQVVKVKDLLETMKSHLPERNTYGG